MQATPYRPLRPRDGLGLGTEAQTEPLHLAVTVSPPIDWLARKQNDGDTQDMAAYMELEAVGNFGVAFHEDPFQISPTADRPRVTAMHQ
jgi:hypothetical protein